MQFFFQLYGSLCKNANISKQKPYMYRLYHQEETEVLPTSCSPLWCIENPGMMCVRAQLRTFKLVVLAQN